MTGFTLSSPRGAEDPLGRLLADGSPVRVRVSEDVAFGGDWLDLGTLALKAVNQTREEIGTAVRRGAYGWTIPAADAVSTDLRRLCGFDNYLQARRQNAEERLPGVLNQVACAAVRAGITWPRFDAGAAAGMPFKRPATVVADTSGVLQGAMSFVACHLHPMARMKIPAVLHMEVINQADRFLKTRRTPGVRGEILLGEHLSSQAAQRALLRLELREDAEVERNLLLADPLRSAFVQDTDPDLRHLNLSVPLRSYVDRMILETARQHQSFASPGHPVHLLTADQGLAKMALAEGIEPLFFRAVTADELFGRTLSGTLLHPFTGRLIGTGLANLLWELATAFGRIRLDRADRAGSVEVAAMGRDLPWSAFHSHEDLLWLRTDELAPWPQGRPGTGDPDEPAAPSAVTSEDDAEWRVRGDAEALGRSGTTEARRRDVVKPQAAKRRKDASLGAKSRPDARGTTNGQEGQSFSRFSVGGLVRLVDRLSGSGRLSLESIGKILGISNSKGIAEYRRFLASGDFIAVAGDEWIGTDSLIALATAQREEDRDRMSELLAGAPSYAAFLRLLDAGEAGQQAPVTLPMPSRVQFTYVALGEVTAACASITREGCFPTPARPSPAEFAAIALERFDQLAPVDGLVSSGEWLEELIRRNGIHPVVARDSLQEADAAGYLKRSIEGSTTDTRHDDHTLKVLRTIDRRPVVETVHIYRGDFLIPGQASSSLRLQRTDR